jgi:hypothetical protein
LIIELLRRFLPQLLILTVVGVILAAVYHFGVVNERNRLTVQYEQILSDKDRAAADAVKRAMEIDRSNALVSIDAGAKEISARDGVERNFKTITKTVIKYVNENPDRAECSASADFVQLWNASNSGTASP